ncbi:hypothetical protein Tco_0971165 [Tanacetum coccineum]
MKRTGKLGNSDVHTLEDPTLILEILSRIFFLRLNQPDHRSVLTGSRGSSIKAKGTSRTMNNQTFTIKKGMSMSVQMSQAQDGERPQVDNQRLDLANDLKEAQDHISSVADSTDIKDQLSVLFRREVNEESEKMRDYRSFDEVIESIDILKGIQVDDKEKASRLILMAMEVQNRVYEKNNFITKLRR